MEQSTLSTAPGMWTWLIILLLFLFVIGGGNGFGWFGGFGNNNAAWLLNGMNNNNNHDNTVDLINNNSFWQQQLSAQQALANQTSAMNLWFCNVNQNIEKAMLQAQQNTCNIMQNCTANTQKVLDMICQNQITDLRASLAEARLEANNATQTATLINTLRPYPVPVIPTTTTTGS